MSKKILIVTENFYPEEFKINEVALEWQKSGFEVCVLTQNPSYPMGKTYNGYKNSWFSEDTWNSITIYRVKTITGYRESLARKILNYLTFCILGSIVSMRLGKRFDYVFGFGVGPLTSMVPAILLNKFYKKNVTIWMQDIWPDSVYAYGFKEGRVLSFFLDGLVRFVYKYTTNFAISAKGFEKKIRPYLDEDKKIIYVPNWSDELNKKLPPFDFGSKELVHFTFAGNIGVVQNLDNIIRAFGALPSDFALKAQLNIIGDGSYLNHLKEMAGLSEYKNIKFWGKVPREEIYRYLSASDFLIVSLIDKPIFALTVPAKVQTYIAANKPILGIIKGEAADIINENNLGFCAEPSALEEIIESFTRAIYSDKKALLRFSENSEKLTNTVFDKFNSILTLRVLMIGDINN